MACQHPLPSLQRSFSRPLALALVLALELAPRLQAGVALVLAWLHQVRLAVLLMVDMGVGRWEGRMRAASRCTLQPQQQRPQGMGAGATCNSSSCSSSGGSCSSGLLLWMTALPTPPTRLHCCCLLQRHQPLLRCSWAAGGIAVVVCWMRTAGRSLRCLRPAWTSAQRATGSHLPAATHCIGRALTRSRRSSAARDTRRFPPEAAAAAAVRWLESLRALQQVGVEARLRALLGSVPAELHRWLAAAAAALAESLMGKASWRELLHEHDAT